MTMPSNAATSASTREHWRDTLLAGLANYIDSGSIVAGASALTMWAEVYKLSATFVGVIGAFSANAISAGVGALIGGRLCDVFGRKKIYQYDMLFYAFGMAWLVFAVRPWMIVVGFMLVGVAVGADIPASWSLIAENAPEGEIGKHSGLAQLLWWLGPLVVLLMSLLLAPLQLLGMRIVFAHLMILGILLTLLRSRMHESQRWEAARRAEKKGLDAHTVQPTSLRALLAPQRLRSMAFLIGMYGIWNLWSGTQGFYFQYMMRTVAGQTQTVAIMLDLVTYLLGIFAIVFIFMRYVDRVNQRLLYGLSALIQVVAMPLLTISPLTLPTIWLFVALSAIGQGFGAQAFFQLWSAELFPTLLRSTAQGIMFAVVRIGLGIWSFFVPVLASSNFRMLAWILAGFVIVSGLIGVIWGPRNEGKSLEQIEAEQTAKALRRSTRLASAKE
jgi:inositol transporter-like SP family MFS transporter